MTKRTKAYYRQQRERTIQRKINIYKHVYQERDWLPVRGKLSKGKVHCSCRMCRYEQFHGIPKAKVNAKWQAMQQEMND